MQIYMHSQQVFNCSELFCKQMNKNLIHVTNQRIVWQQLGAQTRLCPPLSFPLSLSIFFSLFLFTVFQFPT